MTKGHPRCDVVHRSSSLSIDFVHNNAQIHKGRKCWVRNVEADLMVQNDISIQKSAFFTQTSFKMKRDPHQLHLYSIWNNEHHVEALATHLSTRNTEGSWAFSLCGAIGHHSRLLTKRLVVQAHPGTGRKIFQFNFAYIASLTMKIIVRPMRLSPEQGTMVAEELSVSVAQ